jgi:5'/3'-nucleotidase
MRATVTNDDGIESPGLRWLVQAALEAELHVVVAAPDNENSGASAGLSAVYHEHRLAINRATMHDLEVEAYRVPASPSYIVVLASLGTFGPKPDIVLSGINRGANAGHAVLHSGTVGAALTAANQRMKAMAVSLDVLPVAGADPATGGASLSTYLKGIDDEDLNWATAAHVVVQLVPALIDLPDGVVLNVNVPNIPLEQLAGIRQATLAPFGQVQMALAEEGEGYVRTAIELADDRATPGSDLALLSAGFAAVTPIAALNSADISLGLG